MSFPHWISDDYLHSIISKDDVLSMSALDKLVDDIQSNKRTTTEHLLGSEYGEEIIANLMLWLQSLSNKTAGNAAYILGSLAENKQGCMRILDSAAQFNSKGWMSFPDTLVLMLRSKDVETILNAAGTLGTISLMTGENGC
ncbi:hypothetical protein CSKR_200528 [Clonorchis sinensis]|uniref:Uncharacterized protein n=1 Tax=Clonorchis sinensis TaxID=79923 RepID=A0A8T1MDR3_CLOSI|nr:hypothetical protein CSKR_200528 [Clonorchis sinensis]